MINQYNNNLNFLLCSKIHLRHIIYTDFNTVKYMLINTNYLKGGFSEHLGEGGRSSFIIFDTSSL